MSIGSYYYELLGIKPSSNIEEVKRAYHILVRKNHPDLFPDERKRIQELKMVQINEAYARIVHGKQDCHVRDDSEEITFHVKPCFKAHLNARSAFDIGFHKDIEYAYYKQGFTNYSKALHGITRIERRAELRNDWYYLRRFSGSLSYLRKADVYFSRILDEYPNSIWAYDAFIKMKRIEYFSRLYQKIIKNMELRLKKRTYSNHS
jgi:tetratricopeptide (TPR) repeat protein